MPTYSVVDIFAGPGGLAEGFSSVRGYDGERAFRIELSIEKEASAHSTLLLRAFLRQFGGSLPDCYYRFINEGGDEPDWSSLHPEEWAAAEREAWQFELGVENHRDKLDARLDAIREASGNTILIGGPPCQAYSLVGRARNQGKEGYVASKDPRHFLYREYIRILDRLRPAAFVMENVKGMLSSSVDNGESRIFDKVLEDLRGDHRNAERYRLIALDPRSRRTLSLEWIEPRASDFVVRAEDFGVPQARHRVIVIGLRADLFTDLPENAVADVMPRHALTATAGHVLSGMPKLRSGLSREDDTPEEWRSVVADAIALVAGLETRLEDEQHLAFTVRAAKCLATFRGLNEVPAREAFGTGIAADCPSELRAWLTDPKLATLPNHASRAHMRSDLARYFFAAIYAEVIGRSPKASDFPAELAPDHRNWKSGKFADRFRVQVRDQPSTTVTSHISKDGHYFIHPDPMQCRSLTVREAARLQTFPDNYLFRGNRTQQFVQVGNAVPPFLARQIAASLLAILSRSAIGAETAPPSAVIDEAA